MSSDRLELKVGMFMVMCLALAAALAIRFGNTNMWNNGYTVVMEARSAGNLIRQAEVLMAGVPIGYVDKIELNHDNNGTFVHLYIYEQYQVHENDRFSVDSKGLMGAQFVSVTAALKRGLKLKANDHVSGIEPVNLEKIGKNAEGLVQRVDRMVVKVDGMMGTFSNMVHRVDQKLLNTATLTNIAATFDNVYSVSKDVKKFSEGMVEVTAQMTNIARRGVKAAQSVESTALQIEGLVATNSPNIRVLFANLSETADSMNKTVSRLEKMVGGAQPQLASVMINAAKTAEAVRRAAGNIEYTVATNRLVVGQALTNVQQMTGRLDQTVKDIQNTFTENRENMGEIINNSRSVSENLKDATANLKKVVASFQKGEGLAGGLFSDPEMKDDFANMVGRLSTLVSNLNEHGILWKGERSNRNPPNIFKSGKKRGEERESNSTAAK